MASITYENKVALNVDPTIPDKNKCTADDMNMIKEAVNSKADSDSLSSVATSGSYNDLTNKPTIPSISDEYGTSTTNGYSQNYINSNTLNPTGEATTTQSDVSSATITNTLEAPLLMDLKGNTSQNTLSGKNLYNATKSESSSSGITYSCDTQYIYVNNTNSSGTKYEFGSTTLPAGTYSLTLELVSGSASRLQTYIYKTGTWTTIQLGSTGWINVQNDSKKASASFTLSEATQISVGSYMNGNVFSNAKIAYQITSGTSSDYNFEPYCGGVPSPNPSYPQNVNVVSGDNDIVVCGVNLEQEIEQGNINSSGVPYNDNASIRSKYYDNVSPNTTYIVSKDGAATGCNISQYDKNYTFISRTYYNNGSFTTSATTKYVKVQLAGATTDKIQLQLGNTASTFEAYTGTTYNIDLPVENLMENILTNQEINGLTFVVNSDKSISVNGTASATTTLTLSNGISNLQVGNTYYLSGCPKGGSSSTYRLFIRGTGNEDIGNGLEFEMTQALSSSQGIGIQIGNGTRIDNLVFKPMITKIKLGYEAYTPYGTTPIELNKIGTYQDYFYKEDDKWYLHKEVGKYTYNNDLGENGIVGDIVGLLTPVLNIKPNISDDGLYGITYCNLLQGKRINGTGLQGTTAVSKIRIALNGYATTYNEARAILSNIIIYYQLATPTNTEITYTPLINQLNALEQAQSYEGTTNINQVNNDLPFILDITAFLDTYDGRYEALDKRVSDNNNSIQVLNNEVDNLINYSTEEQVIGTWIDGKPIYRKVIDCGNLPNATSKNVATGYSLNQINIVRLYGIARENTGYTIPIPHISSGQSSSQVQCEVSTNGIFLRTGVNYSNLHCYVILEYTKTTD